MRGLQPRRDRDRRARCPAARAGPTSTIAKAGVDDDREDRGDDRGDGVLPGVERAGEDGDQRVGREADEEGAGASRR